MLLYKLFLCIFKLIKIKVHKELIKLIYKLPLINSTFPNFYKLKK